MCFHEIKLDLGRKTNSANQRAKPKALKAQSSKTSKAIVTNAFKPKLNKVNQRPNSGAPSRPNVVINKNVRINNTNNQRPISAKPKAKPVAVSGNNVTAPKGNLKSKLENALQTANSVMRNKQHKNHNEVKQLVDSYKKQWVTEKRFLELLPKLVF